MNNSELGERVYLSPRLKGEKLLTVTPRIPDLMSKPSSRTLGILLHPGLMNETPLSVFVRGWLLSLFLFELIENSTHSWKECLISDISHRVHDFNATLGELETTRCRCFLHLPT